MAKNPIKGMGVAELAAKRRAMNPAMKKDPSQMSAAAINSELDAIDKQWSKINDELIEAGRGYELSSVTLTKDDPLSMKFRAMSNRRGLLSYEVSRRAGPGMYRLPKGFGPLKNPGTKSVRVIGANPSRPDDIPGDFSQSSAKVYGRAWSDAEKASVKDVGSDAVVRLIWPDGEWLQMIFDSRDGAMKNLKRLGFA